MSFLADTGSTGWSSGQRVLAGVAGVAVIADCATTLRKLDTTRETNPLLGAHPERGGVILACGLALATGLVVADLLPTKLRSLFLFGVTGIEMANTLHNAFQVGVRVTW